MPLSEPSHLLDGHPHLGHFYNYQIYLNILQVQRCLSVSPVTYWMATLIWDTIISLVFVTIAAIIIQAFQVIAISIALFVISIIIILSIAWLCEDAKLYLKEFFFH